MKKNKAFFQKIAKPINYERISKGVLSHINYPLLLNRVKPQRTGDSCGLSSMRSVFLLQFGIETKERDLEKLMKRFHMEELEGNGIGPKDLANLMHYVSEKNKIDTKVFVTGKGNYSQLKWLNEKNILPITHRKTREGNNVEHYEICLGPNEREIFLYNSYSHLSSSGFYKVSKPNFLKEWWPVMRPEGREKWYLAVIKGDMELPTRMFNGKYL